MRILRHLSFSNVIAVIALFVALGGAAYAGTKINGNSIKSGSIGGGKLKNETIGAGKLRKGTITGVQIAPGSISSSSIDLSTLGTVPSATNATTATTATSAGTATKADSATTAGTATSATNAENAKHAESADNAKHAESADTSKHAETADSATHADSSGSATHADSATQADTATSATHADEADTATEATEAAKLGGKTAADLTVSCREETEFYGGMCWDQVQRIFEPWLIADRECGDEGGRLPTIGELVAFIGRPGNQAIGQVWSSDLADISGGNEVVLTSDETSREKSIGSFLLGYRCVFPRSN
jgi:hypothetical protein